MDKQLKEVTKYICTVCKTTRRNVTEKYWCTSDSCYGSCDRYQGKVDVRYISVIVNKMLYLLCIISYQLVSVIYKCCFIKAFKVLFYESK